MRTCTLAKRIAAAFLHQSGSPADAEHNAAALEALARLVEAVPSVAVVCGHPRVTLNEKRELLKGVFPSPVAPSWPRLLEFLIRRRRVALAPDIAREFRVALEASQGVEAVEVISARPLESAGRRTLEAALSRALGSRVHAHYRVDDDLLGGFIARTRDKMLDRSLSGRLTALREALILNQGV